MLYRSPCTPQCPALSVACRDCHRGLLLRDQRTGPAKFWREHRYQQKLNEATCSPGSSETSSHECSAAGGRRMLAGAYERGPLIERKNINVRSNHRATRFFLSHCGEKVAQLHVMHVRTCLWPPSRSPMKKGWQGCGGHGKHQLAPAS